MGRKASSHCGVCADNGKRDERGSGGTPMTASCASAEVHDLSIGDIVTEKRPLLIDLY